jgi:hypothetical protein
VKELNNCRLGRYFYWFEMALERKFQSASKSWVILDDQDRMGIHEEPAFTRSAKTK